MMTRRKVRVGSDLKHCDIVICKMSDGVMVEAIVDKTQHHSNRSVIANYHGVGGERSIRITNRADSVNDVLFSDCEVLRDDK